MLAAIGRGKGEGPLLQRSDSTASRVPMLPRIGAACRDHRVCVAVCPEQALTGFELEGRRGVALRPDACTACGRCVELCPEHAIDLAPLAPRSPATLPLSAHLPLVCERCLEPFVGPATATLCPSCAKDLALFRGSGPDAGAPSTHAIDEGERR